jgi:A/G-specific adenine glycosylase
VAARSRIAKSLIAWFAHGHRDLPWRRTTDPYRIWVSEIMLQQTRAQAVIPYYERFLARFPTVEALATAREDEVLALWSGLGYYTRARNLRKAAIAVHAAGGFPQTFEDIRDLAGVGDYTAAAVASIAFGLPHAVVDGNVLRVVARVEDDASDIGSASTRERFREIVQGWLDATQPGAFNQALMELGATVCLPRNPMCLVCPVASLCKARESGRAGELPVKLRKQEPVHISGELLIIERNGRVLLRQREASASRMAGFWDLPTLDDLPSATLGARLGEIRHTITHHRYTWSIRRATISGRPGNAFRWFAPEEWDSIPFCTTARKSLRQVHVGKLL